MPDIYIAAAITSLLSLVVIGWPLMRFSPKADRLLLAMIVLVMLPMNPLAFFAVRLPLDGVLQAVGHGQAWLGWARTLYAPLTEEPAKLWLLLVPWFYRNMASRKTVPTAFAIGLGFGIGEAWTVARMLSGSPEVAAYPWYMLGGYISERMLVCMSHAALAGAALYFVFRGRPALGVAAAMALHFAGNFPIFMARCGMFGLSPEIWNAVLSVWVMAFFMAMGLLLALLAYGRAWKEKLFRGEGVCPACGRNYRRPIFKVNLFVKTWEKCPLCGKWHFMDVLKEGPRWRPVRSGPSRGRGRWRRAGRRRSTARFEWSLSSAVSCR